MYLCSTTNQYVSTCVHTVGSHTKCSNLQRSSTVLSFSSSVSSFKPNFWAAILWLLGIHAKLAIVQLYCVSLQVC